MSKEKLTPTQMFSLIQKKISVHKNNYNNFGNYSYRSCEDILEALRRLFNEIDDDNRCFVNLENEIALVGERYYIRAIATIKIDDQAFSAIDYAREPLSRKGMDDSQLTGATSSYAKKYALSSLLGLDDEKDADTKKPLENKTHPQQQKTKPKTGLTENQEKAIYAICKKKGIDIPDYSNWTYVDINKFFKENQ